MPYKNVHTIMEAEKQNNMAVQKIKSIALEDNKYYTK